MGTGIRDAEPERMFQQVTMTLFLQELYLTVPETDLKMMMNDNMTRQYESHVIIIYHLMTDLCGKNLGK